MQAAHYGAIAGVKGDFDWGLMVNGVQSCAWHREKHAQSCAWHRETQVFFSEISPFRASHYSRDDRNRSR